MEFLRKVKSYVLGEDLSSARASTSGNADASPAHGAPAHRAAEARQTARHQPVLQNATVGSQGGVQGLNWYTSRLKQDGDGDVADEFLEEPTAIATNSTQQTKVIGSSASLQVQEQDLKRALPGNIIVHGGDVFISPRK